ncbi:ABC transporter ATP-binding protein [Devosia honganensis]|uniref:ABC transporter ATP-binding protein n=1 Tax=Devosia honganensis TaxID=1610527 RepID=A0ABV7X107_9HYPH
MSPSPANSDILLSIEGLSKVFRTKRGTVHAAEDVSFAVRRGSIVGLVGESGSGKTTVGRTLLRLTEPSGGRAMFDGVDLFSLPPREMRDYRRRLQIVFQDPMSSLNPRLRVGQIIAEGLEVHGTSAARREKRVAELLSQVGLRPEHATRFPHEFSGGQRQRIGIARALAVEPELIIADEPVSALDVSVQAQILNLILDLQQRSPLAILFIAHDLAVVEYICDEVVVMYLGRIMEKGPSKAIYAAPRHPYTQALLASVPRADPTATRERVVLQGDIPSPLNPPSGCVFRTRCRFALPVCAEAVPPAVDTGGGHVVACIRRDDPEVKAAAGAVATN